MSKIKFRVWTGTTMQGQDFLDAAKEFAIKDELDETDFIVLPTIEGYELMQYTGLKDSEGNEVYAGDILAHEYDETILPWVVVDQGWRFTVKHPHSPVNYPINNPDFLAHKIVIGNVYENPELLEDV